MSPRQIIKNDISVETYWEDREWCERLPEWWRGACGCRRCCHLGTSGLGDRLAGMHPFYLKWLLRFGAVTVEGWALRLKEGERYVACIYPWPRRLHRSLYR